MIYTHIVGVDPGLVHTGCVRMVFNSANQEIKVGHEVVLGPNGNHVVQWADSHGIPVDDGWIEGYRPRSHLSSDKRMVEGVAAIRQATGFTVLDNTGVKKVVRPALMKLLGVWDFGTPTHHQDLRSAARIALLGMLKDDSHNLMIATIVRAHLNGHPWKVVVT